MRYYIADSHFFHAKLNREMDFRGFPDGEVMNEYMIAQWNSRVRKNDEVVILGDLSWGKAEETNELLKRLKGKLYLIRGNHDHMYLKKSTFDRSRFKWIQSYAELNDNKRKVVLCHYPVLCYNGQNRFDEDGNPRAYMLHGHIHNTLDQQLVDTFQDITRSHMRQSKKGDPYPIPCNLINCFCMYSDYVPLTLDEWIENDRKRRMENAKTTANTE